jgi:hypothetical protein
LLASSCHAWNKYAKLGCNWASYFFTNRGKERRDKIYFQGAGVCNGKLGCNKKPLHLFGNTSLEHMSNSKSVLDTSTRIGRA